MMKFISLAAPAALVMMVGCAGSERVAASPESASASTTTTTNADIATTRGQTAMNVDSNGNRVTNVDSSRSASSDDRGLPDLGGGAGSRMSDSTGARMPSDGGPRSGGSGGMGGMGGNAGWWKGGSGPSGSPNPGWNNSGPNNHGPGSGPSGAR